MAFSFNSAPFADLTPFTTTTSTMKASIKSGLLSTLDNIKNLIAKDQSDQSDVGHPDFIYMDPKTAAAVRAEIDAFKAAITAHA